MPALSDLMQPYAVNARISRLRVNNESLQKATGMQPGGANVKLSPTGRRFMYDVFDETREVATGRTPNAPAATISRQPVNSVGVVIPRLAEKMPLLLDDLHNMRPIGGPVDQIDDNGEKYIAEQERIIKQRVTNFREFQVAAMFRGSYTYTQTGEDLIHGFTGGSVTIDFQVPSTNKSQLNMIGGGDIIGTAWDNPAAPLLRDLLAIDSALTQLTGRGLEHVYCTSVVWGFVITNQEVQSLAGSVNPPVRELKRDSATQEMTATLNGMPTVTWHITNNGVNLNGTFTKLIGDDAAVFTTDLTPEIASYYECTETVVDWVGRPPQPRQGAYFWAVPKDDPAKYELRSVHNGIPSLQIPKALCYATVDF